MKHFCVNPYFYTSIHNNEYVPCCWMQKDPDLKQVQQDILNDIPSADCAKCWVAEKSDINSKRIVDNANLVRLTGLSLEQLRNQAHTSSSLAWQIKLSNDCNLACKTCYPMDSTTWYNEWNHYHGNKMRKVIKIQPDIISGLNFAAVKHIEFLGGEPFITKLHVPYLERLLEVGNTDVQLCYTTNGTKLPSDDVLELLSKFNNVNISISLDGIGERFNYLRWPGNWDEVQANIQWYKSRKQFKTVTCMHTISNLTIGYLDEFLTYALKNFGVRGYDFSVVHYPSYFAPNVLPESIKQQITEKYQAHKLSTLLMPFVKLMNRPTNKFTLGRFAIEVIRQDRYRNQSINDYLPEIVFFDHSRPLRKS